MLEEDPNVGLPRASVEDDGIVFDAARVQARRIRTTRSYEGVLVTPEGRAGSRKARLQVDVGFGDSGTPAPTSDFPTRQRWREFVESRTGASNGIGLFATLAGPARAPLVILKRRPDKMPRSPTGLCATRLPPPCAPLRVCRSASRSCRRGREPGFGERASEMVCMSIRKIVTAKMRTLRRLINGSRHLRIGSAESVFRQMRQLPELTAL